MSIYKRIYNRLYWNGYYLTVGLKNIIANLQYAFCAKSNGLNAQKRSPQIIISLTTIPSRISKVKLVIETLMHQTLKPDKILLFLGEKEFCDISLSDDFTRFQKRGLEIKFVEDLKPHKKYYYAMKENRNDIIITVDDDVIYGRRLVEKLYRLYQKFPRSVCCLRAHRILFNEEHQLRKYSDWEWESTFSQEPSHYYFATGVGGVLYPPHCMNEEVLNVERFKKLSLCADDIWLKAMQVISNTKVIAYPKPFTVYNISGTQKEALSQENVIDNKNDRYLQNVFSAYQITQSSFDQ